MKRVRKVIEKHWIITLISCVILGICGLEIYGCLSSLIVKKWNHPEEAETIGRCIASIVVFMGIYTYFRPEFGTLGFRKKGFLKGLWIGGFMIVATVSNLYTAFEEAGEYPKIHPTVTAVLIVIVEALFIGILEEFLFRGFLLNIWIYRKDRLTNGDYWKAIMASSILFGMVHLLNLNEYPQLIHATLIQVEYAVFIGMIFAIIYLRCSNIWVIVFLHFIYDLASMIPEVFYQSPKDQEIVDYDATTTVLNVVVNLVFLVVALFLGRRYMKREKKNMEK